MKTILAVDDTKANIQILMELLGESYDLLVCRDGMSAMEMVIEDKPDLILLDIIMPGLNGFDVCEKLKNNEETKNIPIIFLTAQTDEESIEKAYDIGGIDYITKPFKHKELLGKIKREIQLKELKKKEIEYQKQSSIKELLHNISHHWRQPLGVMSASAGNIEITLDLEDNIGNEELYDHCDLIKKETESLSNTLRKLESIVNDYEIKECSLKTLLDEFTKINEIKLKNENIDLQVKLKEDIYLSTDLNRLLEIFDIFLNNSIDAFKNKEITHRIIYIESQKNEKEVNIRFIDNGGGVDNKIIDNIFEPYVSTKHKSNGVGLSLNHVYNIIESINGSIKVQNIEIDLETRGAEFIITLPVE